MKAIRTGILAMAGGAAMMAQPAAAPAPPATPPAPWFWVGQAAAGGGSYLGVGVADVDSERAKILHLREVRGVELTKVQEDSPAAKAGLKDEDVVLEFNGERVEGTEQLLRMVRETPPNREVKLTISRNGQTQMVSLTTGKRKPAVYMTREGQPMRMEIPPPAGPRVEVFTPDVPRATMSWRSGMLGIEAESLEGSFAEYFGVKQGVLVRQVGKGTPAEKAGLKVGDVITKVDSKDITLAREVTMAMRALREKDRKALTLTLMRDKKEMTVSVTMDDPEPRTPARAQTVRND